MKTTVMLLLVTLLLPPPDISPSRSPLIVSGFPWFLRAVKLAKPAIKFLDSISPQRFNLQCKNTSLQEVIVAYSRISRRSILYAPGCALTNLPGAWITLDTRKLFSATEATALLERITIREGSTLIPCGQAAAKLMRNHQASCERPVFASPVLDHPQPRKVTHVTWTKHPGEMVWNVLTPMSSPSSVFPMESGILMLHDTEHKVRAMLKILAKIPL